MKRIPLSFTVLLAALAVSCATSGSLEALRASHNQAEVERTRAEARAAIAAQRQADAEASKAAAGKALATGLVQAATDDIKAAEAAAARAKAKRAEACGLNPALPECKVDQPPPAPPPAPKAEPAPPPAKPTPATPAEETPQAEPEAESDDAEAEVREAELPHVHIRLTKKDDKTELSFTEAPPDGWEVNWLSRGVLQLRIDGKKELEVKTARLGEGCWRLFQSGTVTSEECPGSN